MEMLEKDMETIKKIVDGEIDIKTLSEADVKRLIDICEVQKENMEKRILEKEEKITRLENEIMKYKNSVN